MSKVRCGIFLYDAVNKKLLMTKSYGSRKFEGYSIPKGGFEEDEDEDYLSAALREFKEECGRDLIDIMGGEENFNIAKEFDLISYKNVQKQLKAFLVIAKEDLSMINFECLSFWQNENGESFPEIASYHWLSLDEAKEKAHYVQQGIISRIKNLVP